MKNKNILDLSEQYNNYIYPKPTENLSEEWIKKIVFKFVIPIIAGIGCGRKNHIIQKVLMF